MMMTDRTPQESRGGTGTGNGAGADSGDELLYEGLTRDLGINKALGQVRDHYDDTDSHSRSHAHAHSRSAVDRESGYENTGVIWLLQALVLHKLDQLLAWRGSNDIGKKVASTAGQGQQSLRQKAYGKNSKKSKNNVQSVNSSFITTSHIKAVTAQLSLVMKSPAVIFESAIEVAWTVNPSLALSFADRYRCRISREKTTLGHGKPARTPFTVLHDLIAASPSAVREDWRAAHFILDFEGMYVCMYVCI
jgi:hypothetical protein